MSGRENRPGGEQGEGSGLDVGLGFLVMAFQHAACLILKGHTGVSHFLVFFFWVSNSLKF